MDLRHNIRVRTADGQIISLDDYQKMRNLADDQIGEYFSYKEPVFIRDLQDYGELEVNMPLMIVLDEYRRRKGSYVNLNSFNRNQAKQDQLAISGFKTALFSPHVKKLAADADTHTEQATRNDAAIILQVSKDLDIPCRIGYEAYLRNGQTFIHVDVCPLYYAKGGVWHQNEHPPAWELPYLMW